jgi:RNA recognition motif-containing protein
MVDEKNKLYVGNLPYDIENAQLAEMFTEYGLADEGAQVIIDRQTGRSKGFGFVTLKTEEAAEQAVKDKNGSDIGGRTIVVNIARPMTERRERPQYGSGDRYGSRR